MPNCNSNRSITSIVALAMFIGMWAYVVRVANPNIHRQATISGDRAGELGDLYRVGTARSNLCCMVKTLTAGK